MVYQQRVQVNGFNTAKDNPLDGCIRMAFDMFFFKFRLLLFIFS